MDQSQNNPDAPQPQKNWREEMREERREWRADRREARAQGGWIIGAVLIVLGFLFLLQNMGVFTLHNWWALFILIPAFGSFSTAWGFYKSDGLNEPARNSLTVGVFLTLLALFFLLEINLGAWWPILLVLGGIFLLFNALRR